MESKDLLDAAQTISVIRSLFDAKPNPWVPVVAAVGGAFVGGIMAILPAYLIEMKKRRDERRSVTNALIAEIQAMISVIEHREYVASLKEALKHLDEQPEGATLRFVVKIPDHYSRVYQSHVDRIGTVEPKLASAIITFHQLIDAIVQDIAPGGLVAEEGAGRTAFLQLLQLAERAIEIGGSLQAGRPRH